MIRYSLFVMTVLFSAASAIAAISPVDRYATGNSKAVTVIFKTQDFSVLDEITVQPCGVEDCSDTPNS
jgi:hypothetical protein